MFSHSYSTEQQPDILKWNSKRIRLYVGWWDPSPFQIYLAENNIQLNTKCPYGGTNNYREHIAYWEIIDSKLYFTAIAYARWWKSDTSCNKMIPASSIIAKSNLDSNGYAFANWYSGILVIYEMHNKACTYIKIEKGIVKDSINSKTLRNEYTRYLENYIRTSFDNLYDGLLKFQISTQWKISERLFGYYKNGKEWPYGWESQGLSGAPQCTWFIKNNKIYLKRIILLSGLEFSGPQKTKIPLSEIFKVSKYPVFGNWVNGYYIGYNKFLFRDKYVVYKFDSGLVTEKRIFRNYNMLNEYREKIGDLHVITF